MRMRSLKSQPEKGFTLVETLVALGLFAMVMVVAVGIILSVISSNRQNQAVNVVVNNLNYSIESMVRDIKTGFAYRCYYTLDTDFYEVGTVKSVNHFCNAQEFVD